jgi:hypothetical protein
VLEMFLWTTARGRAAFGTTPEFAEQTKVLAANQGLYNGFLAAGLAWSLIAVGVREGAGAVFPRLRADCRPLRGIHGEPAHLGGAGAACGNCAGCGHIVVKRQRLDLNIEAGSIKQEGGTIALQPRFQGRGVMT